MKSRPRGEAEPWTTGDMDYWIFDWPLGYKAPDIGIYI